MAKFKVKIKLEDNSEKEIIVGAGVDMSSGLEITVGQVMALLNALQTVTSLMTSEKWKLVEIEPEEE